MTTGHHVIQIESFGRFFGDRQPVLHLDLVRTPSARDRVLARATAATALAEEIRRSQRAYALALPLLDQAIEIWQRLGDRPRANAARLSRLRVFALAAGEDELATLESAVPWLERAGEDELLGWLWIELGRERERPESKREELLQNALAIHEKLGNLREQAVVHNELGNIASDRGRFQLATEHFEGAIRLAERCGDPTELAIPLLLRGVLLTRWNRPEDAIVDLFRARDLFAPEDRHHQAMTFEALGSAYLGLGRANQALSFLKRAKLLSSDVKTLALTLNSLGLTLQVLGQSAEAQAAFRESLLHYARLGGNRVALRRVRFTLATALVAAARPREAQPLLERTLDEARTDDDSELRAAVSFELARLHYRQGRSSSALSLAMEALGVLESWPYQVSSLNLRTAYLAKRQPFYELALDVLLSLDSGAPNGRSRQDALETSDRARSQALRDLILTGDLAGPRAHPSGLARQRELTAEIRSLRQELATTRNRQDLEERLAIAVRDLDLQSSRLRLEASAANRPTIDEIQAGLDPDAALLHFHFGQDKSRLFVVTRKEIEVYPLAGRKEIEAELDAA
ncbi:MAG: tetratricopeptide repeat protein, partial [Thermoanaerobaculia bacterium]|nr:tetratricopeptide repeat protein [Thermoanaerobaculia bacterium]